MLRNYFKITIRNLLKYKFYTFINVVGLAIGMAGFLFITLYILDELSYDRFLPDADRIYRVSMYGKTDGDALHWATAPAPLAPAMMEEIPEVEAVTRVMKWNDFTIRLEGDEEKMFKESKVYYVEKSFFKVLGYKLLAGDPETALSSTALVITQDAAERYFGKEALQPEKLLGRTLLVGGKGALPVPITGIVENPPANTHFHFDMLISVPNDEFFGFQSNHWTFAVVHTYVLLHEVAAQNHNIKEEIEDKLDAFVTKYVLPFAKLGTEDDKRLGYIIDFRLQPITAIHLHSNLNKEHEPNGNIVYVYIFNAVALFILLLACINFMNLSTARAIQRAKEVGVRKVLGSSQNSLIKQFLFESISYSLIALFIALGFVELLRIPFHQFSGKVLTVSLLNIPWLSVSVVGIILAVGLLAGSYPAFYLSSFQPNHILKGKVGVEKNGKGLHQYLRSGLVVFQFTISIALIVCTLVVYQQLRYIQNTDLGFDRENIIVIHNDRDMTFKMENFTNALKAHAAVLDASFTTLLPAFGDSQMRNFQLEHSEFEYNMKWFQADENYINTLGLEMKEGRWFSEKFVSDTAGIIVNEAAVAMMGLKEPVLGQYLIKNKGWNDEARLKLIGVVKDYNYESFYHEIKPLAIELLRPASSFMRDYIAVRLAPGDLQQSIAIVEEQWKAFEPNIPMVYSFLDEDFASMFRAEQRMGIILSIFSGLAVFIACLGLFGLAAFTAEKRTKEIGIRKVLGASVTHLVMLLSKDFAKLVLLAMGIAIPLAYIAMQNWLTNFAYRISISVGTFILAGVVAIGIAWLTVGYQAIKAATANPVDTLRDE